MAVGVIVGVALGIAVGVGLMVGDGETVCAVAQNGEKLAAKIIEIIKDFLIVLEN
jgi:hypothetical protein